MRQCAHLQLYSQTSVALFVITALGALTPSPISSSQRIINALLSTAVAIGCVTLGTVFPWPDFAARQVGPSQRCRSRPASGLHVSTPLSPSSGVCRCRIASGLACLQPLLQALEH